MNDSPVDCQNRDETEPQRDAGAVRRLKEPAGQTFFASIPQQRDAEGAYIELLRLFAFYVDGLCNLVYSLHLLRLRLSSKKG